MVDTKWNGRDTERCRDPQKTESELMHHRESLSLECALHTANERFRQRGRSRGAISEMHGYTLSTDGCFRFHLQLITSRNYQETPLGACVLDSRAHEPVDQ